MEALVDTSGEEHLSNSPHRPEIHHTNNARLPTGLSPTASRKKMSFISAGPAYGLPRLADQIPRPSAHTVQHTGSLNQIKEQRSSANGVGGDAWRRWFQRHRKAFRSLSLKMQVMLQEQATKVYDTSGSRTRKPDRITTQTVVQLLQDLSDAPGEMGTMQRTLNREIFRCICQ